ncbi:Uncharacterised protein [uncultured archaeon]|nr:Uncharacterised protein [uncultured archaeon]
MGATISAKYNIRIIKTLIPIATAISITRGYFDRCHSITATMLWCKSIMLYNKKKLWATCQKREQRQIDLSNKEMLSINSSRGMLGWLIPNAD